MKKERFSTFDAADYLGSEEDIAAYLDAALEDGDPKVLVVAVGNIVRARNVSQIAREVGLTREGIYKAFSPDGNPSFATVLKVTKALDLDFAFLPRKSSRPRQAPKKRVAAKVTRSRKASTARKESALSRR